MGIRGLNTCIQTIAPNSIQNIDWKSLEYKRIGIDIQCFIYRAIANKLDPLVIIAEQIVNFRKLNITPIYIFDGKPPVEKDIVVSKRRTERNNALEMCKNLRDNLEKEVDSNVRYNLLQQICELEAKFPSISYERKNEIKKFMYAVGVLFVTAISEADNLLAYLYKRRIIDVVATFDLDFLPRGTDIIVPKNIKHPPGTNWSYYDYSLIETLLGLNNSQFIDLCVLMGSDYTSELTIVPWNTALNSIKSGYSMRNIWERHTFSNWRRIDKNNNTDDDLLKLKKAKDILMGIDDSFETLLEPEQILKFTNNSENNEQDTMMEFKKKYSHWNIEWWPLLGLKC
jgi:flap endonuclease-1